jgi:hypothetical protein
MATARKMITKTVSDDEIQTMFEESFASQVGKFNGLEEFEVKCVRVVGKDTIKVEVTVQGLAGAPTAEDFKKGKIKNVNSVKITRDDKGSLEFQLLPKETIYLNSTEYIVVYQSI